MRYSKELLKGGTPLLVMSVLDGKDLHALEQEGCLKSDWRTVDGRRRKYYHLTDKGRRQFAQKKAEFLSYTRDMTRVLEFA